MCRGVPKGAVGLKCMSSAKEEWQRATGGWDACVEGCPRAPWGRNACLVPERSGSRLRGRWCMCRRGCKGHRGAEMHV